MSEVSSMLTAKLILTSPVMRIKPYLRGNTGPMVLCHYSYRYYVRGRTCQTVLCREYISVIEGTAPPYVFQTQLLHSCTCPSDTEGGERLGESNVLKTKGGAVPSTDYILLIYILWSFVIILLEIFRYLGYAYAQYLPRPIDTRIFRTRGIFFEAYGYLQKQRVIFRSRGTFFEAEGYISSKSNAEGYLPNQRDMYYPKQKGFR